MSRALAVVVSAALLAGFVAIAPVRPLAGACAGAGSNHATLLVQHGDGSVVTRCVAFESASITGEQLLNDSGVKWSGQAFGGFGVAVCAVDGEPATYASCPGAQRYWALFVERGGGSWQLTPVGVSTLTLADGDGLGVRYVPTAGTPDAPPTAASVCAAAASSGADETASPVAAGSAVASASAAATSQAASVSAAPVTPSGGSDGPDLGMIAVAVAAACLVALAAFRLLVARRRPQ
jgi:hypothetical protein